jgi:hypothetical protein
LHGVPDLSGRYRITLRSSHDKLATRKEGTATITQGWKKLVIRTTTESSTSVSTGAWLVDDPGAGDCLTYVFLNTPKAAAPKVLETHEGTATVIFTPDGKGAGEYYSGRGRSKHGEITFECVE